MYIYYIPLYITFFSRGLYYTSFYEDNESKAYLAIKDIYGPSKPIKNFEWSFNTKNLSFRSLVI